MVDGMKIEPLGDSALTVCIGGSFEKDPEGLLKEVLTALRRIEAAKIPGIVEGVPALASLGIFYDAAPVREEGIEPEKIFGWVSERISNALSVKDTNIDRASSAGRVVEVPVCYDPEFALDLAEVEKHTGLNAAQIVERHSVAEYLVHCLGFTPGFPYLSGLPGELATPRRAVPRTKVPAGSVAIGGRQAGIYPLSSPGGWNIIGRTSLVLFDANREEPALLHPGDRVKFRPISRDKFERSTS